MGQPWLGVRLGMMIADADMQGLLIKVGQAVAKLHDGGLIHGDLTTSNMIIRESDQRLVCQPQIVAICL